MTDVASYYTLQKRPRSVTIVVWGVFLLGLANGWRAIGLGQQADLLLSLGSSLNPWVGVGLAVVWCVSLIIAAVALWQNRNWTQASVPGLILVHGLYQIALVIFFAQSAVSRNVWPVLALAFGAAFLFSIWALKRPSVCWYFR